jgi:hypothetical protein
MLRHVFPLAAAAAALAGVSPTSLSAQAIAWSQYGSVTQRLGDVEMEIRYRRSLIHWERVWAPGADSATTIRFTGDVVIAGHPVPAGTYSIWMIPRPGSWTVILSRAAHVYHTPYPEGQDLLRLDVTPEAGSHMETLTFHFPVVDGPRAELAFQWGETRVTVPIEIEVEDGSDGG